MDALLLRRRAIMAAKKSRLPDAYQEVAYLEGTGTQFINTGFFGSNDAGALIRFALTSLRGTPRIFGTRTGTTGGTGAFAFITTWNGLSTLPDYFFIASNGVITGQTDVGAVDTDWHTFSCNIENDKKVYFDNRLIITGNNTQYSSTKEASIFRSASGANYQSPGTAKISIVTIYLNAVIEHSYIPCYRKADNKPGVYDLVTKSFFTNAGTGEFTVGPDVN